LAQVLKGRSPQVQRFSVSPGGKLPPMIPARTCAAVLLLAGSALAFRVRPKRRNGRASGQKQPEHALGPQADEARDEAAASLISDQQQVDQASDDATLYIMGYGSLMKESSRIRSTCDVDFSANQITALSDLLTDEALKDHKSECFASVKSSQMILVKAEGVRRGWYLRGGVAASSGGNVAPAGWEEQGLDVSPTYLGALQDNASSMYAVVYRVTEHELNQTDIREGGYHHLWMDPAKVRRLDSGSFPDNAKIRWYANPPESVNTPTMQTPICQSYVDLWLSGALELQKLNNVSSYVENVVDTTYGWSPSWVNDRPTPYRPFTREPAARSVAKALLAVARNNTNTVAPNKVTQPLTIDILKSVRFPGMAVHHSRASRFGSLDVVLPILALIGLGSAL